MPEYTAQVTVYPSARNETRTVRAPHRGKAVERLHTEAERDGQRIVIASVTPWY